MVSSTEQSENALAAIQIPDDPARGLADIAALQKKSVEQIAVENLRLLFDQTSSPEAVLQSIRSLPHPMRTHS